MPGGALDAVHDRLIRLAAQGRGTLGISFVIGLAISLWGANGGIKTLFDALNAVYEEKEERSFIRLNAVSLLFTVGMIVFLMVSLACVVAIPIALNYLPPVTGLILDIARWPVLCTVGEPKPLGWRGAKMADTIGPASNGPIN